jgi:hypothetical protein
MWRNAETSSSRESQLEISTSFSTSRSKLILLEKKNLNLALNSVPHCMSAYILIRIPIADSDPEGLKGSKRKKINIAEGQIIRHKMYRYI